MQRSLLTMMILGGLVAFSPIVEAQRPEGGGGRGRGPGGFRGGPPGGGQSSMMMLIGNEQVQKEIGLEGESLEAVKKVVSNLREQGREQFSSLGNLREMSEEDRNKAMAEMRKQRDEINAKATQEIEKHLSKEQKTRLEQIALQQQGVRALDDDKVVVKLELSEEQQLKIAELLENQMAAQQKLMESIREGGREGFAQAREKSEALRKETDEKLMGVLTDAQKTKFAEMKGKPFELQRTRMQRGDRPQGDRGGDRGANRGEGRGDGRGDRPRQRPQSE
ncbi:hypothetical protein [Thalassoglobus sp.]|uniref:hypothetical protein n=1 Tax=Thalassoglobus sp. TaxID=2795869 RepID=UPI003AA813B7